MSVKEKLNKCFKEGGKGGGRHKGLKKIEISEDNVAGHINKAVRNFHAITAFKEIGYSDWSASAAFYSLYHLLLAILTKYGFESRNQSCTFAFVEDLIDKGKISLTKNDLKEIFDKKVKEDLEHSNKILDLRESWQYSTKTTFEDKEFDEMKNRVKRLFDKLRKEIEND